MVNGAVALTLLGATPQTPLNEILMSSPPVKTGADFIFAGSGAVALTPRKASGIVQFWEGWVQGKVSVTIPPIAARIFSGDSTSPLTRGGKNVVRSEGGLAIPPS